MFHLIWMFIVGLVVGAIARLLMPGVENMGWIMTSLVGIAGSFVGGTLANLMHVEFYGWVGNLVVASVGAIIVLWLWRRFRARSPAS